MALQEIGSLWGTERIKEIMERFRGGLPVMSIFDYPSGSSTPSSYTLYQNTYDKAPLKLRNTGEEEMKKIREKEKEKEDLRDEPQYFDPKELDLDDNK